MPIQSSRRASCLHCTGPPDQGERPARPRVSDLPTPRRILIQLTDMADITIPQSAVPGQRVRRANRAPVRPGGRWVLYWMVAQRRVGFNFALERAAEWARHLGRPLLILEALRSGYPFASDRLHAFILQGMADNRVRLKHRPVTYHPYVEQEKGGGRGLLQALAEDAAVVVGDDYPCFFIPRMVRAAAPRLPVRFEVVDSNGILPMDEGGRDFPTAYAFRRHLQKELRPHLRAMPLADPLAADLPPAIALPEAITGRWPAVDDDLLEPDSGRLAHLPIDHAVQPVEIRGGTTAAEARWRRFLEHHLDRYGQGRRNPAEDTTSGLSPYLHFGHIGAHQIVLDLLARERWSEDDLGRDARGKRSGWWGLSEPVESFLDQVVTWRELGFNTCRYRDDYDQWTALPDWARKTLETHAFDDREHEYRPKQFEAAATHDPLWNAAQRQLLQEGRIHNYLRMLWGKKILEWSGDPKEALDIMVELNDRWALDGRDPNSYSGILWVLGRHDRPWGPERPIYGSVRYMSSANTARKMPVQAYLDRYR